MPLYMPRLLVVCAVHEQIDFGPAPGSEWKEGEERVCKMVFIGRNLDHAALEKGFRSCLVD